MSLWTWGCEINIGTLVEHLLKAVRNFQREANTFLHPDTSRPCCIPAGQSNCHLFACPGLEPCGCRENSALKMEKVTLQIEMKKNRQEVQEGK